MKTTALLIPLVMVVPLFVTDRLSAATIAGAGGTYSTPFAPADTVTFDAGASGSPLLNLVVDSSGSTTGTSGVWSLTAQGGTNISALGTIVDQSGAQTALTGTSLQFNRDNGPNTTLLGLLGSSTNLQYAWSATATFSGFTYAANSQYNLSFHVDGSNGLLQGLSGVNPTFTAEFVDGSGTPLTLANGTTSTNLAGLLGLGLSSGDFTVTLNTGSVAPTGTVGIRFLGDATVNSVASTLITNNLATVSNMSLDVTPVPEPTGAGLVMVCGVCVMFRRRRRLVQLH